MLFHPALTKNTTLSVKMNDVLIFIATLASNYTWQTENFDDVIFFL